jgi:hypothetical protein
MKCTCHSVCLSYAPLTFLFFIAGRIRDIIKKKDQIKGAR